jgi:hypothetical protein
VIRRVAPLLVLAAASLLPAVASAQQDQAKMLFNAGAQAYEAGQFAAAVQAFEQAYKLAARPGILFSIAQAHRKQYYVGKSPEDLRAALKGYRDYLAQVTQGGRRSDAAEAVAELEPLATRMEASGVSMTAPAPAATVTRLMVSSQTAGAVVSVDGGKPAEAPLFAEVKPGKHALRITAPGFIDETREIDVPPGVVSPVDIALRERPGKLSVRTQAGAQVSLDGRLVAVTPLPQAIDVEPGRHVVAISKNGYGAYTHEIEVGRGESKTVDAALLSTAQRKVSYVLFGAGVASVAAGGVLVYVALQEQKQATQFQSLQTSGKAMCGPRLTGPNATDCDTYLKTNYTNHVRARDDFRRDAGIVIGAGVAAAAVGVALFAADFPSLLGVVPKARDSAPKAAPVKERSMEMSAVPLVVPGFYGASLTGTF